MYSFKPSIPFSTKDGWSIDFQRKFFVSLTVFSLIQLFFIILFLWTVHCFQVTETCVSLFLSSKTNRRRVQFDILSRIYLTEASRRSMSFLREGTSVEIPSCYNFPSNTNFGWSEGTGKESEFSCRLIWGVSGMQINKKKYISFVGSRTAVHYKFKSSNVNSNSIYVPSPFNFHSFFFFLTWYANDPGKGEERWKARNAVPSESWKFHSIKSLFVCSNHSLLPNHHQGMENWDQERNMRPPENLEYHFS